MQSENELARSSEVERLAVNQDITGSIPVGPAIEPTIEEMVQAFRDKYGKVQDSTKQDEFVKAITNAMKNMHDNAKADE